MITGVANPYVGLRPFETSESILFFGRNAQTIDLLQRLHQHHFVSVVGNSGCGKSSLLRAGLIPALKAGFLVQESDQWAISIMKPGQNPLYNLAQSILDQLDPNAGTAGILPLVQKIKKAGTDALIELITPVYKEKQLNFFLLIDQFEELFRYTIQQDDIAKQDAAIDFVNIMLELTRQVQIPFYVVITMRSDFIGDCSQFYGLPEAMNESQYLVPRLNRLQLKTVIEGPAKLYGIAVKPALSSKLLNDLNKVKDELPLLQHVMMRVWEYEFEIDKSNALDLVDYENVGGIDKALSNHADEALEGMHERELAIAKKLFQALTAIDENGRKIKRPVLLSQLKELTGAGEDELLYIINRFIQEKRSFLVISTDIDSGDKIIDISHESLIRQWAALCEWVDEEADAVSNYLHLAEAASLHQQKKKDFLTGSELLISLDWNARFKPVAAWANRYKKGFDEAIDYLYDSDAEQTRILNIEKARRKKRRQLIYTVMGLILLFALGTGIAIIFINIKNKEIKSALNIARANYLIMEANSALREKKDPTLALRLFEEASRLQPGDTVSEKAASAIYKENFFYKIIANQKKEIQSVAFSPPGSDDSGSNKTILTASTDSIIRLWGPEGNLLQVFKGHSGGINAVVFSPDGKSVLSGSADNTARLWDLKGNTIQKFSGHSNHINSIAFSPNGKSILTGSDDSTARLWDLKGRTMQIFKGHSDRVRSVAFSATGEMILTGSYDKTARLWNLAGNTLQEFKGHTQPVLAVAFAPGDKTMLTGSWDSTARLWSLAGKTLQVFKGSTGRVFSIAFSPDEKSVLTGSDDGSCRLWNLNGITLREFKGHTAAVSSVGFLPDGKSIFTGSWDKTARLWNLKLSMLQEFNGHRGEIYSGCFSPDGKTILTGSFDSTARLWDLKGTTLKIFKGHSNYIRSAVFSPDGKTILTGSVDKTARLWDLEGNTLQLFKGHTGRVLAVAFSPACADDPAGGKTILTGSGDGTCRLWDLKGNTIREFKGHSNFITSLAFAPDGKTILTGSEDNTARLWDLEGRTLQEFKGHSAALSSVAFSPDGKSILTGSWDLTARLWDLKGRTLQEFTGHTEGIWGVAFSPACPDDPAGGKTILTGSGDNTARIWDLKGKMLQEFTGHTQYITHVAFSPDGKSILTSSADKTARLWDIVNSNIHDFLKSDKIEPLSYRQKNQYGIK